MAKIRTRRRVDLGAVDRRLSQIGLAAGLVQRANESTGEFEIESADASISDADLLRVVNDVPEVPAHDPQIDADRRTLRRDTAAALAAKQSWTPKDTESALRLLLEAEIERG